MGRMLDILIVLILAAWLLGWIFSVIVGVFIHVLLVFALIAIGFRIYWWFKRKRSDRARGGAVQRSADL